MAVREKVVRMEEAVGIIRDGDLISMTAGMDTVPMALIREIIRKGKKELQVVGLPGGALNWDILIGADCVGVAELCSMSFGGLGPAPNFKRYAEAGRLNLKDNT